MTIPAKDYCTMWANMSASIVGGMEVGAPEDPAHSVEQDCVAHSAIKIARVILDHLGIEAVPPVPPI